jgi:DNA topoisomerase-1
MTEKPKPPFTTSTLQQEAGRKLRYGSSKTMAVAQRLYERGFITYMRTDSTNLSEQALGAARRQIVERFGQEYLPDSARTYRTKVKNAQEAHEAIRPAGEDIRPPDAVRAELDADERSLYELIWIRTIASQMADARALRVVLRIGAQSSAGERAVLRATGKTYEFLGFRRAYVEDVDDEESTEGESRLPAVVEGERVALEELRALQHETKPPARYTEASLVKELEERGIGRPSTYASVIQTIQNREYVWRKGNALVPAWMAFAVVRLLEDHFGHLVDYGFTAAMEEALDVIARGEGEAEKWLHSFYFGNGEAGLRELVGDENLATIDPRLISTIPLGVDDDGNEVVVRVGRYGPYVQIGEEGARGSIPPDLAPDELTLELAVDLARRQAEGPQALGEDPASGLKVFVLNGRFGPYVQLGELDPDAPKGAEKPRRASLFKTMQPETVTLDDALRLLSLPRVVGAADDGEEIVALTGRYGPYIKKGSDTRSLDAEDKLLTITMPDALALLATPKTRGRAAAKPPIAELGESPDTGTTIRVLDGRFGPYVTDGTTNATVPRGTDPESVTLPDAIALLRARAAAGPSKRAKKKAPAKKKAAAKKKTTAKKTAKKKATKKAAPKSGAPAEAPEPAMRVTQSSGPAE